MNSILRKSLGLVLVLFIMVLGLSNVTKVRATETEKTFSINSFAAVSGNLTASDLSTIGYTSTKNNGTNNPAINSSAIRLYSSSSGNGNGCSFQTTSCPENGKIKTINISLNKNNSDATAQLYGSTDGNSWTCVGDSFVVSASDSYDLNWSSSNYKYFKVQNVSPQQVNEKWPQLVVSSISIVYTITGEVQIIPLTSISLTSVALKPGQSGYTTITYNPANATDKVVTYEISDENVASVAEDGKITAKAAGVTTLKVIPHADPEKYQTCTITVTDYPAPALTVGNTYYLTGTKGNTKYELKTIEKVSSNIVGTIQSYQNYPSLYPLLVEDGTYVNTVAFKNGTKYLSYTSGSTLETKETVDAESSWLVSIVNEKIVIKNVKAQNMQIMFNSSSDRFACYAGTQNDIELYDPTIVNLSISADSTKAYLGGTLDFNILTNVQDPVITWTSSNTGVATIDSNGVLHPVAIGKTNIKATINDVDSNVVEITVLPNPENPITISQANAIAETVGTTGTTDNYTIVGFLSYIQDDSHNINLTDHVNTIKIYKYNHGYTDVDSDKKVQVTGKIKIKDDANIINTPTIKSFFVVTFDPDNGSSTTEVEVVEGGTVDCPTPDPTKDGYTFTGWKKGIDEWDFNNDHVTENMTLTAQWVGAIGTQFINLLNNYNAYMSLAYQYGRIDGSVTDSLNLAFTGVSGSSYVDWSKVGSSIAKYVGSTAGGNSSIQFRSNTGSGIVTTVSGGYARTITISFNSNTDNARTIDIYGKNNAYTATSDLYGSSSEKGSKLGSIVCGTSTSLTISGDYEYIGIRSNSGAIYVDSITIEWDGKVFNECDFRLRCGIQNEDFASSLAAISGDATYGIEVKTTSVIEKTVNYASNNAAIKTDNENNMIYVLISLGDALSNPNRLGVEFTVRPYIEYESVKYYATDASCAKTYSVAQMVESYHNNPSTQDLVASLYALLQSMDIID